MRSRFLKTVAAPVRESGAVLLVSLLLMVVITVLALGANQITSARTSSAARLQARESALQAAEAALSAGERVVNDRALTSPPTPCSTGRCRIYAANVLDLSAARRTSHWWTAHASSYAPEHSSSNSLDGTWFVIEEFASSTESQTNSSATQPQPSTVVYYRVTSASSNRKAVQVVLQSVFARQFSPESDERLRPGPGAVIAGRQSWRQIQ